ncbi:Gfo/Idh/MocA family protein [Komagataeibacter saccharivorans]|uniref:Gfo/Idh/MocA family protein n=1 Tax=Komagataeibacter saccharivorans TaxID=265959 RepID=UPI0039EB0738
MEPVSTRPSQSASPDRSSIGWGIVGTGTIARCFAEDLEYVAGAHLAGVSSRVLERAAQFVARHGGAAHESHEALLGDEKVDAVYIASPNTSHFTIAFAAIAAKKSVLVEKPLVATAEEAERLRAFAAEQNVFLMEGLWTRFLPAIGFVKNSLQSATIGEIRRVKGELAFRHPYAPDNRFFDPAQGGGSLLDLGIYLISLSQFFLGESDAVRGEWYSAPSGVDMGARMELTFGRIPASLNCAFDYTGGNLFIIEGSRRTLFLQSPFIAARQVLEAGPVMARVIETLCRNSILSRIFSKISRKIPVPGIRRHAFGFPGYGLQFEIEAATRAIRDGKTEVSTAPLSESIQTLRIIEKIRTLPPGC